MSRISRSVAPASTPTESGDHAVVVATHWPGRASWVGFLRLLRITIPIKGYAQVASKEEVALHQLHAHCGQRIRQQKLCPDHGPVDSSDLVKGYEHAPNQYVVLDDADLEWLRRSADRTAALEQFVEAGQVDPAFFSGRSLYLLPDGRAAQRPFAVLAETLRRKRKWAVGRAVLYGHRHPILVRPADRALVMDVLHDPVQVKGPLETPGSSVAVTDEELQLAGQLVDAVTGPIRWSDYRDGKAERLASLIEAKLQGCALAPSAPEETVALPLLDALRQSLAAARQARPSPMATACRAKSQAHRKSR